MIIQAKYKKLVRNRVGLRWQDVVNIKIGLLLLKKLSTSSWLKIGQASQLYRTVNKAASTSDCYCPSRNSSTCSAVRTSSISSTDDTSTTSILLLSKRELGLKQREKLGKTRREQPLRHCCTSMEKNNDLLTQFESPQIQLQDCMQFDPSSGCISMLRCVFNCTICTTKAIH